MSKPTIRIALLLAATLTLGACAASETSPAPTQVALTERDACLPLYEITQVSPRLALVATGLPANGQIVTYGDLDASDPALVAGSPSWSSREGDRLIALAREQLIAERMLAEFEPARSGTAAFDLLLRDHFFGDTYLDLDAPLDPEAEASPGLTIEEAAFSVRKTEPTPTTAVTAARRLVVIAAETIHAEAMITGCLVDDGETYRAVRRGALTLFANEPKLRNLVVDCAEPISAVPADADDRYAPLDPVELAAVVTAGCLVAGDSK